MSNERHRIGYSAVDISLTLLCTLYIHSRLKLCSPIHRVLYILHVTVCFKKSLFPSLTREAIWHVDECHFGIFGGILEAL